MSITKYFYSFSENYKNQEIMTYIKMQFYDKTFTNAYIFILTERCIIPKLYNFWIKIKTPKKFWIFPVNEQNLQETCLKGLISHFLFTFHCTWRNKLVHRRMWFYHIYRNTKNNKSAKNNVRDRVILTEKSYHQFTIMWNVTTWI